MQENHLNDILMDGITIKDSANLKLPIFKKFRQKSQLDQIPEKPEFKTMYNKPLAAYLINKFLNSVYSLDKAIFYKDIELFKEIKDRGTLKKVTRLIYNRYLSPKNSIYFEGQSVFRTKDIKLLPKNTEFTPQKKVFYSRKSSNKSDTNATNKNFNVSSSNTKNIPSCKKSNNNNNIDNNEKETLTDFNRLSLLDKSSKVQKQKSLRNQNPLERNSLPEIKTRFLTEEERENQKQQQFKEIFESTDLLSGNVLGIYGKDLEKIRGKIMREEFSCKMFDSILNLIEKDLIFDLFPRFLNSFYYIYYLKFKEMTFPVLFSDFQTIKVIGRGAFGVVKACIKKDTGYRYAVKCISKKRAVASNSIKSIINERKILKELGESGSRFLLGLNYALFDKNNLYFVLDLMIGGDLKYHLNREGFFDEDKGRFYAAEILVGLEHMHSKHIIYRDLKLENVLLNADGHCKLSDFGLSVQTTKVMHGYAGTPGYTAPEIVMGRYYTRTVDFFSFGVLVYRLLSGKKPFNAPGRDYGNLDKNVVKMFPHFPQEIFSPDARDLISRLLEKEPSKRLGCKRGAAEIREHRWFRTIDFGLLENGYLHAPFKPNLDEVNSQAFQDNRKVNEDRYKKVVVPNSFEKTLYKDFHYIKQESFQKEVVAAIEKVDEPIFNNGFKSTEEKKYWYSFGKKDQKNLLNINNRVNRTRKTDTRNIVDNFTNVGNIHRSIKNGYMNDKKLSNYNSIDNNRGKRSNKVKGEKDDNAGIEARKRSIFGGANEKQSLADILPSGIDCKKSYVSKGVMQKDKEKGENMKKGNLLSKGVNEKKENGEKEMNDNLVKVKKKKKKFLGIFR